ncbi:MAG: UvrD-helicase domain-containing protein [Nannocystaceae bacterium]
MDLAHLNPPQREAVEHVDGPLLILAGAGSGKTRVITHRVARLLELGIPPDSIVALSFTNKAAGEMRSRLVKMVGKRTAGELALATFHSLGSRMMREDPDGFGVPERFTILDQGDVYGLVRALLHQHGVHGPGSDRRYDLGAVVQRISLWKNDFLDPQAATKAQKDEYDEVAAVIFPEYQDRLRALGAVDFDDLVCHVADVLARDEALRARWQARFAFLMVDEYQDTNRAQFQLIKQLCGDKENLCVVGDDDQAIYGWRGAKVENILSFDVHFPDAKIVRLEANYRSRPAILSCANALIQNNELRHDKELRANRPEGENVTLVTCQDDAQETKWLGQRIHNLIFERKIPGSEIAVLYRSARQAKAVEENLQEHGIAYQVLGGQAFYDKKQVRDVLAYLTLLLRPGDEPALRRTLDVPPRGIGRRTVEQLGSFAKAHKIRMIDAVHRHAEVDGIASRPQRALADFSQLIHNTTRRIRADNGVAEPLRELLSTIKFKDNILKETGSGEATRQRWGNVEGFIDSVGRFSDKHDLGKHAKWNEYLNSLRLDNRKEDESQQPQELVTLATLHSAKGLEWSQVFMIGCEEGTMPHKRVTSPRASDAIEGDLEEERRLFYVGMTRARDDLFLMRAAIRVDRGRESPTQPSRFLAELPPEHSQRYDVQQEEQLDHHQMMAMADDFLSRLAAQQEPDPA